MVNRLDTRFVGLEYYSDLIDSESIAKNYLSVNQSFVNMYYDDFKSTNKTDPLYVSKVFTEKFRMIPGNAGSWYSKTWTAGSAVTEVKMSCRVSDDFDFDIEVSVDGGTNWFTISTAGDLSNMDMEFNVSLHSGTSVVLRVLGGTLGYLQNYIILTK